MEYIILIIIWFIIEFTELNAENFVLDSWLKYYFTQITDRELVLRLNWQGSIK